MPNKHLINGVIKSEPKVWSKDEIELLVKSKQQGLSFLSISELLGRTEYSCNRKYYKVLKTKDAYNDKHRELKYNYNRKFISQVQCSTLLDAFSGGVSWWKKNTDLIVTDNDLNIDGADYKLAAYDFLCKHRKIKFDVVDLDPFGSAYECFDLALEIAQKGLIITFGEIVGRRFNRMDFVEHRYNIQFLEDFTTNKLSEYVEKRALIYRKKLTPLIKAEMTNISRVYYSIEHFDYGASGCKYFPKKPSLELFPDGME